MFITWIVIIPAYLQLCKSEAMSWNNISSSPHIPLITSKFVQLKQDEIPEKTNFSEGIKFDNFTKLDKLDLTPKKTFGKKNSTVGKMYERKGTKMDPDFLHKAAHLETNPKLVLNGNNSITPQGKSLPSESNTINNILLFTILSIFILALISVAGLTMYTRNSRTSIQINQDISKDEKKLRYKEVATEEPANDEETTSSSWRKTLISKISLPSTFKLKLTNNSSNLENEIEIQTSGTPSTRTLSTASIRAESCIDPSNEAVESKDEGQEKLRKQSTMSRTLSFLEKASCISNKGYEDTLNVSKKICEKCNHYREPQIIMKRIEEVERRGERIFIPIQLPVTIGSGKIKSLCFPKLPRTQSTTSTVHQNCQRGSCCIGNQSNYTASTPGCSQKNRNKRRHCLSGSSTEKSKMYNNFQSSSSSGCSQQHTDEQCFVESGPSTKKSNKNEDCLDQEIYCKSQKFCESAKRSPPSTCESKSEACCPTTQLTSCDNKDCFVESGPSTEKFNTNEDCLSSKSVNFDQEIYCQSQKSCESAKPSAPSTCKSKSEACPSSTSQLILCDNKDYFVEPGPSTEKSNTNEDCLSSKSVNFDQEIYCQSQKSCESEKPSAPFTCKSKSEVCPSSTTKTVLCDDKNALKLSTTTLRTSSMHGSSSRTARVESQNEDHYSPFSLCLGKIENAFDDASDAKFRDSSSYNDVSKLITFKEDYNDEPCQDASSKNKNKHMTDSNQFLVNQSSLSNTLDTSHQLFQGYSTKQLKTRSNDDLSSSHTSCKESNQCNQKCSSITQLNNDTISSKAQYKAPMKFKVLSTDPDYDPSTLQVKQQLKMLLQNDSNSKESATKLEKDQIRPGQVIYADLCFVEQKPAVKCSDKSCQKSSACRYSDVRVQCAVKCNNVDPFFESTTNKGIIGTQSSACSVLQKHGNYTSESESDLGYGPSQSDSNGSEDPSNKMNSSSADKINYKTESCYRKCLSKICYDEFPRARSESRQGRRSSIDATMKSSISADSRGNFIQSLNQRLKGNYLQQSKGSSSRSRLSLSSRCAPVFEYAEDTDDGDVYEHIGEHIEYSGRSMRNSMNKLLPRIRSYMSKHRKSSICGSDLYCEPSIEGGPTELCENCLKFCPRDISKTIRSRKSIYSDVEKFKHGGTIHLNDLIAVYPNLYPKLPSPVREALAKGFDEYSVSPYGNLCENNELVQESKWSELSSSFENINCTH